VSSQQTAIIVQWMECGVQPIVSPIRFAAATSPHRGTTDDGPLTTEMSSHYVPNTRIPTLVFPTSSEASRHVALIIESLIRQNNSAGLPTVLGLATGSTPVGLYRELIRLHKEARLDLSKVITFNLDEYYPMTP